MRGSRRRACLLAAVVVAGCVGEQAPDDGVSGPPEIAGVMPADEAIAGAHVSTIDPAPLDAAEIEAAIGRGARCEFRYTNGGEPVLGLNAATPGESARAVIKLNNHLVMLDPTRTPSDAPRRVTLVAEPVRVTVEPDAPGPADTTWRSDATMIFEVNRQLRVGYRGSFGCVTAPSR